MTESSEITYRQAARVLVLNGEGRVLLFRCEEPGAGRSFWITPGGGLEDGEDHEQAALRELREETGLVGVELGPCVWTRTHTFPWLGKTYRQRERFFVMQVDEVELDFAEHTEEELTVLQEHCWWSAEEIVAATQTHFAPRQLGALLAELSLDALPDEPIDVGV